MSAPVEVLAVLDAEIATLRRLESWVNEALAPTKVDAQSAILAMTEARAAVAELIETNRALLAEYGPNMTRMALASPRRSLWMRLRDALARIGGAA